METSAPALNEMAAVLSWALSTVSTLPLRPMQYMISHSPDEESRTLIANCSYMPGDGIPVGSVTVIDKDPEVMFAASEVAMLFANKKSDAGTGMLGLHDVVEANIRRQRGDAAQAMGMGSSGRSSCRVIVAPATASVVDIDNT